MKVRVIDVTDKTFDGNDGGKIAGVELAYLADGKPGVLQSWIPPVVAEVLKWKADEEHEIEEYEDKKGRTRFKTPQAGRGGGGFKGLSFSERMELDTYQHERMDRRTALMTAQDAHGHSTDPELILDTAGLFYKWLRKTASEPHSSPPGGATARRGSDTGAPAAVDQPAGAPPSSGDKPGAAEAGAEGDGEAPSAPVEASPEQRDRLMQVYKRPSAVKARAAELFGYDPKSLVLLNLSSSEVEALILEAAS